ncbi:YggS family pyridoxal phosphate-dependent enzyme [Verrucomicrobia bacterium LW23]|nr:YggS family pyridoxal phosphate-dependent enzyme [Verrucomicrobia bacterium LW23]
MPRNINTSSTAPDDSTRPAPLPATFAERLAAVRARMERAAANAGRRAEEITLVGVSKNHPREAIDEAWKAGVRHFGESKTQEARLKMGSAGGLPGTWHFIGHLQTNKAKDAAALFSRIDSVDTLELARELDKRAGTLGRELAVLLQVNVAGESAKFGLRPDEALAAALELNNLRRLRLEGLMLIAPYATQPEKVRPIFAKLRELRDAMEKESGLSLPVLSMGMSHDLEVAIEEGATEVRVGTDLFGERKSAWFGGRAAAEEAKPASADTPAPKEKTWRQRAAENADDVPTIMYGEE